jgi:predicted GNAT family N-acyltransferase
MASRIELLEPPGQTIANYNRSLPCTEQSEPVPHLFTDAMIIREEVFVEEQKVPLENELDEDDPRCWHWISYDETPRHATSSTSSTSSPPAHSDEATTRHPTGTIRLVPPPHPPHAEPGSEHQIDGSEHVAKVPLGKDAANSGPTSEHNAHNEPYIKLGRLAVQKEYRGKGSAKRLVETALEWAAGHGGEVMGQASKSEEAGRARRMEWRGLVLVHAQVSADDANGVRLTWEEQY